MFGLGNKMSLLAQSVILTVYMLTLIKTTLSLAKPAFYLPVIKNR